MDPVRNPFAPGAGAPPPEFVGREEVLEEADVALKRLMLGRSAKSRMLLGLRGTGKTVLLNFIADMAREQGYHVVKIEAPETGHLPKMLFPRLQRVLRRLSASEAAKALAYEAMRALRSFGAVFKLEGAGVSLSVDPDPGVADSGQLDLDLPDLFGAIGRAAKADGKGFAVLIDEVQYLNETELGAVITALHHTNQNKLPVLFFGAGLPQVAGLSGDAKSYAERLFQFHEIGALNREQAMKAIGDPIADEGESITEHALQVIAGMTEGYPYFLQEWGFQAWNVADNSPIDLEDIAEASRKALQRLDESFFRVRMDRLTPMEREYVFAMGRMPGDGPYKTGDIAKELGETSSRLGPRRHAIIKKGMIYSPAYGVIDFTVPGFKDYLWRSGDLV